MVDPLPQSALRVLYVSTEVHPALKTGGLADVNAGLPPALIAAGVDVRLLLPAFPALRAAAGALAPPVRLGPAFGAEAVALLPCRLDGVPALLIEAGELYARPGNPYVDTSGREWPDNARRFALLGWVAARIARDGVGGWTPDIVHSHDWHAALANVYLKALGGAVPGSVFTVHNLSFQGQFAAGEFAGLGLPPEYFGVEGLEFYGRLNFMKAGLVYADRITTVSPAFAQEIQTPEYGCGLDGLLRARRHVLSGILNGIDTRAWDPSTDAALPATFDSTDLSGKGACKVALRREAGLAPHSDGPLLGVISRLTPQKGLDLLLECVPQLVANGAQLALLGTGEAAEEDAWRAAAVAHPGTIAVRVGYDEALAHRIFAAADLIVVPSRFEPCGLTQLYAQRYGALPLVRRTGGLADTVVDADALHLADGQATGFVFEHASAADLAATLARASALWRQPAAWRQVQARAMQEHYGWQVPAAQYLALYRALCGAA